MFFSDKSCAISNVVFCCVEPESLFSAPLFTESDNPGSGGLTPKFRLEFKSDLFLSIFFHCTMDAVSVGYTLRCFQKAQFRLEKESPMLRRRESDSLRA